jgi:hypothetical protein
MATSSIIIIILCLLPVMYALYRGLDIKASFKVWIAQFSFETKQTRSSEFAEPALCNGELDS